MKKRKRIDWAALEPEIFSMLAGGKNLKEVAAAIGVNYNSMIHWYHKGDNRSRYVMFLHEKNLPVKRDERRHKIRPFDEDDLPAFQTLCDAFRTQIKIGSTLKNLRYGEKGVVIAKYKHVFTMLTNEGFLSSYGYNCFMDFRLKGAKA